MHISTVSGLFLMGFALSMAACSDEQSGQLRVIHLSPDAPGVDVYFGDAEAPRFESLEFGASSTYASIDLGPSTFSIASAGAPRNDAVTLLGSGGELNVTPNTRSTVVIFDAFAAVKAAIFSDNAGLVVEDTVATRDGTGAELKLFHAATSVGPVDVWNVTDPANPSILAEGLIFGAHRPVYVPDGAYVVGLDVDDDQTPDLTFDLPPVGGGITLNVFAVTSTTTGTNHLVIQQSDNSVSWIDAKP